MTSDGKEASAFVRGLADVLAGAKSVNELAEALVREAVHQTLALVAQDHPLDYATLVARYSERVVAGCCAMTSGAVPTCRFETKAGKPCTRRAAVDGVCTQHLEAWRQRQEAGRRQQVYAAAVARRAPTAEDPHVHELKQRARKRVLSMTLPSGPDLADLM